MTYLERTKERQKKIIEGINRTFKIDTAEYILKNYGIDYYNAAIEGLLSNEISSIVESCRFKEDIKSLQSYAFDVIVNWVIEDQTIKYLNNISGLSATLSGADKERRLLYAQNIESFPDVYVEQALPDGSKKEFYVEVISDSGSFWINTGKMHMRVPKYDSIVNKKHNHPIILMMISLQDGKYQTIFFDNKDRGKKLIESHKAYEGKPVYEFEIDKNFKNFKCA